MALVEGSGVGVKAPIDDLAGGVEIIGDTGALAGEPFTASANFLGGGGGAGFAFLVTVSGNGSAFTELIGLVKRAGEGIAATDGWVSRS